MTTRTTPRSRSDRSRLRPALLACLGAGALASGGCYRTPNVTILPGEAAADMTKLVGEGRLPHKADFVELQIEVHSQCYARPIDAVNATDAAVAKIMGMLSDQLDANNSKDDVFSRGGYTAPYSRYDSKSDRTFCEGTFQKSSTVIMKTSKVDSFAKDFAELQNIVFTTMSGPADPKLEQGVTVASVGTPTPQLYFETRERLEREALADALENARAKFEATADAACEGADYHVLKFVESSASAGRPIAYAATPEGPAGEDGAVGFDAIWVNKLLDVYFVIDSRCRAR